MSRLAVIVGKKVAARSLEAEGFGLSTPSYGDV